MVERKLDPVSTRDLSRTFVDSIASSAIWTPPFTRRCRAHREQVVGSLELMQVSANSYVVLPDGLGLGYHTLGFSTIRAILSVVLASVVFHLAIAVSWASGSSAVIVIAVSISIVAAALILAGGVVSTTRGWGSSASARWCTITATSVGASVGSTTLGWAIATGVEAP